MTCNNHYIGLGEVPICNEAAILPLVADVTGTWAFMTTFNDSYQYVQFAATVGQSIVVPARLNENYHYAFRLYKPGGSILNDTYYCIKTIPIVGDSFIVPSANDGSVQALAAGRKQFVAIEAQTTITLLVLQQAEQLLVFVEGSMLQEGNDIDEYLFDTVAGSITFNTPLVAGQKITLLYFK